MRIPFPRSYWVEPGRLLAGYYPGAPEPEDAEERLAALLDCGIRCTINLMEEDERDHQKRLFVDYRPTFARLAEARGVQVRCLRFPVRDVSVPTPGTMRRILDAIDGALENGEPVYLHCWGGLGRTGTAVGCWLARHGLSGEQALQRIAELRRDDAAAHRDSPETGEQCDFVLDWRPGE